jgi:hypothetical protein
VGIRAGVLLVGLGLLRCQSGSESPSGADAHVADADVRGRCDPVDQACPAGSRCDYVCDSGALVMTCVEDPAAAGAQDGEACSVNNVSTGAPRCRKGDGCFAGAGKALGCYRYCRTDADCATGKCDPTRTVLVNCGAGNRTLPALLCL